MRALRSFCLADHNGREITDTGLACDAVTEIGSGYLLDPTLACRSTACHRPRLDDHRRQLLDRFTDAWQRCDIDALTVLLREDVILSMPPELTTITGRAGVVRFFATVPADQAGVADGRAVPGLEGAHLLVSLTVRAPPQRLELVLPGVQAGSRDPYMSIPNGARGSRSRQNSFTSASCRPGGLP
jgi:hypothetical protein